MLTNAFVVRNVVKNGCIEYSISEANLYGVWVDIRISISKPDDQIISKQFPQKG